MRFEVEYDSSDGLFRVRDNDLPNEYVAMCTSAERAERVRAALEATNGRLDDGTT